jgi:hypothetical protein
MIIKNYPKKLHRAEYIFEIRKCGDFLLDNLTTQNIQIQLENQFWNKLSYLKSVSSLQW